MLIFNPLDSVKNVVYNGHTNTEKMCKWNNKQVLAFII